MPLEDLSLDDLAVIAVEAVRDTRNTVCSLGYLTRLVHGDERVPARVKDPDVLAAVTVAVEYGWLAYERPGAVTGRHPNPLPSSDGTAWLYLTDLGLARVLRRDAARVLDWTS